MSFTSDEILLGVDLGTQSLRAGLFNPHSERLAMAERSYPITRGDDGRVEQDPKDWWEALVAAVRQLGDERADLVAAVRGMSCAATSCTVVACDADGQPLRPALLWMDERAHDQADRYSATESPRLRYAGGTLSPQWMLPKALWLSEHQPDIYARTAVVAECVDWMTFRLTGRWVASRDNAASKWNYVTELGGYPDDLLAQVGPTGLRDRWPEHLAAAGSPVGTLRSSAAAELGLPTDVVVAVGGIDAHAGAVAMGALGDGVLACSLGTSNCLIANTPQPRFNRIWGPFPEALRDGTYTIVGGQTSTGATIDWLGGILGRKGTVAEGVSALAAEVEPASHGLVFLDFLQGNRMPYMDSHASGAIWGLRHEHTAAHVARAVIDGLAVGTRLVVDEMCRGFEPFDVVRAAGGLTRSVPYMHALATALGQPVEVVGDTAVAACGAAVWAALGAGLLDAAGSRDVGGAGSVVVEPGPQRESYEELLGRYEATYRALRPLMHSRR